MLNFDATIISQYQNAPVLSQLIANMNEYLDPSANIDAFYNDVWNIDTAQGYGLDLWGRIVCVQRVLNVATAGFLGFDEANPGSSSPFGQGIFFGGGAPATGPYALPDDEFRTLILAKALANITDCSIPAINQILLNLFPGRGNCYCTSGNLTMSFVFSFSLSNVELAIIEQSGALPSPAGVTTNVVVP